MQPQIQSGDDAERALGADEQRRQVVARVVVANLAVPVHQRAVGQRHIQTDDLLAHVAVAHGAQPAGVRRRHAADRRGVPRGQVDTEHQTRRSGGALHLGQRDSGADADPPLDDVDVADLTQPLRRQQHVIVLGHRPGNQRGPAALNGDEGARVAADAQHGGDLVGRPGPHQHAGVPAVATGVVDAAPVEDVGIGADMCRTDDRGQPVGQRLGHPVGVSHGASDKNAPSSTRRRPASQADNRSAAASARSSRGTWPG